MVAARILASASVALRKSRQLKFFSSPLGCSCNFLHGTSSLGIFLCKASPEELVRRPIKKFQFETACWVHSVRSLDASSKSAELLVPAEKNTAQDGAGSTKVKRKKLKGKRAVVRWLKFFRWKKKKEYERMTTEEKILYKLRKAERKEERLVESLKKLEPAESSETTHDPEILTPEEHFFFLKMGLKCKNYVPVGRRGIYQGVILNMHLHWKKHQTLQVVVKTFTPEEVKEIASELARLTGGIVLDIHEENTIIMYRGKNYAQPPTEIMSPRVTLSRKKALDKSKCRDGLRAVRKFIPRLKQELQLFQARAGSKTEIPNFVDNHQDVGIVGINQSSDRLKEIVERSSQELFEEDETEDSDIAQDSEDLSDIFETDSDSETEEKTKRPLFLDEFEKFPSEKDGETEDFKEHLRRISVDSRKAKSSTEEDEDEDDGRSPNFDEVDQMFMRAASLLKSKRR